MSIPDKRPLERIEAATDLPYSSFGNPAGRMYAIARAINEYARAKQSSGHPKHVMWASLFGIHQSKTEEVLRHLADVMPLPLRVRDVVQAKADPNELPYIAWVSEVDAAMRNLELTKGCNEYARVFGTERMVLIRHCATMLPQLPEGHYPGMAAIRDRVSDTLDALHSSALPDDFRRLVTTRLFNLLTSIDYFIVNGGTAIIESAERGVGVVPMTPANERKWWSSELGRTTFDLFRESADWACRITGMIQLTGVTIEAIGNLSPGNLLP